MRDVAADYAHLSPGGRVAGAHASAMAEGLLQLILASGSPRRRELLTEAGFDFTTEPADIEELHEEAMPLRALTRHNALEKARVVAARRPDAVVLAADTLVSIDGTALTKPVDMAEAARMLGRLSGRTHEVVTAVALVHAAAAREESFEVETLVTFKPLSPEEQAVYLTLINPLDKAGGYAAQEHGERIIAGIHGSWTNVVGLPMDEATDALARFGVRPAAR